MTQTKKIRKKLELSAPQEKVLNSVKQRNLFMAGVGSGKSYVAAPIPVRFAKKYPWLRGFIGANTYSQLSKSTLDRIFNVWLNVFGLIRDQDYVVDRMPPPDFKVYGSRLKKYDNTISFKNGHLIILGSLDNYTAIDGTEFAYAILDETKDTKEVAVKEVITARLRQPGMYVSGKAIYDQDQFDSYMESGIFEERTIKDEQDQDKEIVWNTRRNCKVEGYTPLYVFTSPAKVDWINEWFGINDKIQEINSKIFSKTDFYYGEHSNVSVTVCSTYHNEKNLSLGYIDNKLEDYAHNPSLIDMLIYGCPVGKSGGEWFSRFDRTKHVREVKLNPDLPIHLSIDENVVPYMTMLVSQFEDIDGVVHWRTLKEYCLENPKNNAESLGIEFLYDFSEKINGLYYGGDPSSKKRSTLRKGNEHIYDVIEEVLQDYLNSESRRVLRKAPSLPKCRDFFNKMLNGGLENIKVEIDPGCKNLIADMEFLKEDAKGGYKKTKVRDNITKETYEKYGHCADAWRYQGVIAFPDEWNKEQ